MQPNDAPRPARRPLRGYLLGLGLVVAGAGLMELTASFVPLALAGAAALMLTVPLVRQIARGGRRLPAKRR